MFQHVIHGVEHHFFRVCKCFLQLSVGFRIRHYGDSLKEAIVDALWKYTVFRYSESPLRGVVAGPFGGCTCRFYAICNATAASFCQTFFILIGILPTQWCRKYILGKGKTRFSPLFLIFLGWSLHGIDRKLNRFRLTKWYGGGPWGWRIFLKKTGSFWEPVVGSLFGLLGMAAGSAISLTLRE